MLHFSLLVNNVIMVLFELTLRFSLVSNIFGQNLERIRIIRYIYAGVFFELISFQFEYVGTLTQLFDGFQTEEHFLASGIDL